MLSCLASPKRADILGFQISQNEIVAGRRKRPFNVRYFVRNRGERITVSVLRMVYILVLTFAQKLRRQALAWSRLVQKSIVKKKHGNCSNV